MIPDKQHWIDTKKQLPSDEMFYFVAYENGLVTTAPFFKAANRFGISPNGNVLFWIEIPPIPWDDADDGY